MAVLAGGCRCGRGGPRGVGGALNRGSAPYLGTALGLHPFRTQWVGSTAVVPIAHRRGLIKHLQVNESSLRGSPFLLRVCRCLAGAQPRCLPACLLLSSPLCECSPERRGQHALLCHPKEIDPVTKETCGPATGPAGCASGVAA